MDSITLENFRCFRDKQEARLAPLTLLVGDNSTGKTSFMAMIRALWDVAYEHKIPDFKEAPYDLGSFDDIAHHRGRRGGRATEFGASFESSPRRARLVKSTADGIGSSSFFAVFARSGTAPVPVRRRMTLGGVWLEERLKKGGSQELRVGTSNGSWKIAHKRMSPVLNPDQHTMHPLYFLFRPYFSKYREDDDAKFIPLNNSPDITDKDLIEVGRTQSTGYIRRPRRPPYASAPVRSRPRRTYDPARVLSDPEGDHVPMYLANMYFQDKTGWTEMKGALEKFGRASGLFDEIDIKQLGKRESEPFQLRVRKFGNGLKGPPRNLIDVGYGVSQVLPVITELFRRDAPSMFLLQQPEVHLHPSAQAALGSLFCELAERQRQILIETHSDHLLDRVRMDVRDERGKLSPKDVSILFFERLGLDVRIHSLKLDEEGNVLDAPESYRAFFMKETQRSLGL